MEHGSAPSYGLWELVIINSAIFVFFAFSFFKPRTKTDWRTFGGFSAFVVALMIEMYGFPLTIFLLSGWLTKKYPQIDFFAHDNGHLLHTIFGLKGNPHFDVLHILSIVLIGYGFYLLSAAWRVLYQAQKSKTLATAGPYQYVRHPQYVAFTLIMLGFLFQWPTIPTLIMFPILVFTYYRLSLREESAVEAEMPDAWRDYARVTPRFFPRIANRTEKPYSHVTSKGKSI